MSSLSDEFTLYAKAELLLRDAAAPVLGDLLRKIESDLGVYITELRVTVQRRGHDERGVTANCTIVSAQPIQHRAPLSSVPGTRRATDGRAGQVESNAAARQRDRSAD